MLNCECGDTWCDETEVHNDDDDDCGSLFGCEEDECGGKPEIASTKTIANAVQ